MMRRVQRKCAPGFLNFTNFKMAPLMFTLLMFVFNICMIYGQTVSFPNQTNSIQVLNGEATDPDELRQILDKAAKKFRLKRYIGTHTLFFKETELEIRQTIPAAGSKLDLTLLPKFGGEEAKEPFVNLIQVLSHTRSYRDGPVDGDYSHTTSDTISVSVDPTLHRFNKIKWTIYAGSRHHRCVPQLLYGNGHKVVFDCFTEGTYYAFFRLAGTFKNEEDVVDGNEFKEPEEAMQFFDHPKFEDFFLNAQMFFTDFENELLQSEKSTATPWYYSDPIKIYRDSYCYRWSYRIIKENEVGFVHLEPNPTAIGGVYKEYTLKVWIVDPSEASQDELNSPSQMHPSAYSQIITRRFYLGGLVPCLRRAHTAIEVVSDASYVKDGDVRGVGRDRDSSSLEGPYWKFRLKVYMDRVVATLSDIVFTITPRQHSALYECFISDVRVYIPARSFHFLPETKVSSGVINLGFSSMSEVERRFHEENVVNYYGQRGVFVGPPYLNRRDATVAQVFSNPCINQELALSWRGSIGTTSDFFVRNELERIVLPSFDKNKLGLRSTLLQLSEAERKEQLDRSNNPTYSADNNHHIEIFGFAYTPVDLIFLTSESTLYLHSTDLSLRGIGYNTITQKYKLGSLVQRKWCASTSTPKSHNMWIPAFSRDHGNFVIIYHIPAEGARVIKLEEPTPACETIRDTTKFGIREVDRVLLDEKAIHKDEEDDARIDRVVQAKLRTAAAELKARKRQEAIVKPVVLGLSDMAKEKTFWMVGTEVLKGNDPHYASGETAARNVRIATTGLDHYNDNVIFQIDSDFKLLRLSFENNGLSFDMDEILYTTNGDQLVRPSPNNRLFSLHSVQFTGVEKRYLLTVGFQSTEFPKTISHINSTLVMVITFQANDLPVVLNGTVSERDMELTNVDVRFSGTIIRRLQASHKKEPDVYSLTELDFVDAQGRTVTPGPLSRMTTKVHSINTASPLFVLRINEVILFASLDGSFGKIRIQSALVGSCQMYTAVILYDLAAKPILVYEDYPIPEQDVIPKPFLPFKQFDVLVTEQGVLSVLSHKEFVGNKSVTPSRAFIGSVLANEPLRYIQPFHLSNNIFQSATEEGEIVYGQMSYNEKLGILESPPRTTMLNIPFWSLLKGSFARSAGEANIPLDRHAPSQGSGDLEHFADPLCPFASFDVYFILFPYVEAQYITRITAEVAFYGDVIPLEADVIVEFTEVQGVSVVVASFLEVNYDLTIIRKTVEIETFLPLPTLDEMYNKHLSIQSDDEEALQTEEVRVFTLTIRPSLLNLHCQKKDYFKTIQLNVGCVPFTRMRLISEALPLKKVEIQHWRDGLTKQDLQTHWYHNAAVPNEPGISHLVIPRDSLHHSQRKLAGCEHRNETSCRFRIPAGRGIEDNVYGLSFRDVLVPKFEQFLTQHARRVTGNVVIYDLLDSYKDERNYRMGTNTTQYNSACLVDDGDWYGHMAQNANFDKKELSLKADIYRYFVNCFTRSVSYQQEDLNKPPKPMLSIQQLNNQTFYVFNRTNGNALRLQRRRNFIYLLRAVVVNTEYNTFTYCSNMDTFFALQVANMAPQRVPLRWEMYLIVTILVIVIVICSYIYFARYKHWRTRIVTNRILTEDLEDDEDLPGQLERELEQNDPFRTLTQQAANLERFHKISADVNAARSRNSVVGLVERKPVTLDLLQRRISAMAKKPE